MKRISAGLALAAVLAIAACGGDPDRPEATGKASIRAINAIAGSRELNFLIEERLIDTIPYKFGSATTRYDDLDYTFNVDVLFVGESSLRRIARQFIDVVADRDYTLLLTGTVANATITVWEDAERSFVAADTVFQARFAHASESLGNVDYYFDDPAVAPVLGNQAATLSFGEISPPVDVEQGDFVLTITAANDPGTVLYRSETTTYPSQSAFIFTSFDGDANDTAPIVARAIASTGTSVALPDPSYPPTVEFVNASAELGTSDIYDDEMLTSLLVPDHAYRDVTAEFPIAVGENTFFYTPAGSTGSVSLETSLTGFGGIRYRLVTSGPTGNILGIGLIPDRAPTDTAATLLPYHTGLNFEFINIYVVEPDEVIDETTPPARGGLGRTSAPAPIGLAPGTYDLVITEFRETETIAGPYRIDVARGDVVDFIVVDTVDPAMQDLVFLSGGPTP